MNPITYRTQYNNRKCAYTLIDDGAQLILVRYGSRMPGSSALTQFLNNSHIFPSSSHLTIIFTYTKTPLSPLSSYVHYILLCQLPLMMPQTCVALLMRVLTNFAVFVLLLTPHGLNNSLPTPRNRHFSILGDYVTFNHSACCLGQLLELFFRCFMKLVTTYSSS